MIDYVDVLVIVMVLLFFLVKEDIGLFSSVSIFLDGWYRVVFWLEMMMGWLIRIGCVIIVFISCLLVSVGLFKFSFV